MDYTLGKIPSIVASAPLLILSFALTHAEGSLVNFRRGFGGSAIDSATSVDADGNGIYIVGITYPFDTNLLNAYITKFNNGDAHQCCALIDLDGQDQRVVAKAVSDKIYMLGRTAPARTLSTSSWQPLTLVVFCNLSHPVI